MKAFRISLIFIVVFAFSGNLFADTKVFVRDYTYEASPMDDKASCQAIALEQVKRQLLEELGTYVESVSTVRNYQMDHDQIKTLTAGVVQTKILQESWDGNVYWMKVRLAADPDEVAESINQLKDNQQLVRDLREARREADDALAEIERLKSAMAKTDTEEAQQSQYEDSVRQLQATDWLERGQAYATAGEYDDAVEAYNQAVSLRPDAKSYSNLALAYVFLGNYRQATAHFDRGRQARPHQPKPLGTQADRV